MAPPREVGHRDGDDETDLRETLPAKDRSTRTRSGKSRPAALDSVTADAMNTELMSFAEDSEPYRYDATNSAAQSGWRRVPAGRRRHRSRVRYYVEWIAIVFVALTVALTVRATMVQAFYIPSESMVPTLKVGDRLLVNKFGYKMHDVARGDIVVFRRPPNEANRSINDLIKRVIGLPGDTVEAQNGKVLINDRPLDEGYLPPGTVTINLPRQVVPVDMYWVMGDNRGNSSDSRVFGPIDRKLIVGRAFLRVWPLPKAGRL